MMRLDSFAIAVPKAVFFFVATNGVEDWRFYASVGASLLANKRLSVSARPTRDTLARNLLVTSRCIHSRASSLPHRNE
jgi:hypothetical protein